MENVIIYVNLFVTIIGIIGIIVRFSNKFAIMQEKIKEIEDDKKVINKNMENLQTNFNQLITEIALLRKDFQILNSTLLTTVNKLDNLIDTTTDNIMKINSIETFCKLNHKEKK